MPARERRKGAKAELEVARIIRDAGWPKARRTSDGREQALRGDITHGPAGVHLEVKRFEKAHVWEWWEQAQGDLRVGYMPVVAFRRSRAPWLALTELDDLLPLLALKERG
jgi:Holliday junction resolvase